MFTNFSAPCCVSSALSSTVWILAARSFSSLCSASYSSDRRAKRSSLIVMALLLIYFTMLLWDRKSPRACIVRVTVGTASIVAMLIVPFIFHYPYKVIYVWFPVTVCMTLTITLTIALINIFAGCFWWFRDKMGS